MKWFEGGIPQAIQAAKNNKSVFIVFISGGDDDDKSKEMESYLHEPEVTQFCETNQCIPVKLLSDSNDCKFFSQIFPVVVIPSTFFIGDTGTPLEVIGECKSNDDFMKKVKGAIELQKSEESTALGATTQNNGEQETQEGGDIVTNDTAGAMAASTEGNGDEAMTEKEDLNLEDKVEKARELIRIKQEQKMLSESEEAKRKEQERRKVGQGVQKLRETQKETEMLEAKKELKRDREDDKIARQRVKDQIARDREEKNARFSEAKAEKDREAQEAKKRKLMEQQAAAEAENARRSDIARIQFRLPDGTSITQQFPATDTFDSVFNFITGQMGCAVTLATTYPRRDFTTADHGSTLQELLLAPTAVILVIPGKRGRTGISSPSNSVGITSIVLSPFIFLWNILASLFGFSSSSPSSSTPSSQSNPTQSATATGGERNSGGARKRESTSKQQGAIHKFHNAEDDQDDEDRNTWNGNSTQQM